jgi:hypothetical protein
LKSGPPLYLSVNNTHTLGQLTLARRWFGSVAMLQG